VIEMVLENGIEYGCGRVHRYPLRENYVVTLGEDFYLTVRSADDEEVLIIDERKIVVKDEVVSLNVKEEDGVLRVILVLDKMELGLEIDFFEREGKKFCQVWQGELLLECIKTEN